MYVMHKTQTFSGRNYFLLWLSPVMWRLSKHFIC